MSYIGTDKLGKMFLGELGIAKAYLGNDMVFDGDTTPSVTVVFHPSSFDYDNSVYRSIYSSEPITRAFNPSDNTSPARVYTVYGEGAETDLYFKFDTSTIPEGASIVSVKMVAACVVQTTSSGTVAEREEFVSEGTTDKGVATTINLSTDAKAVDAGSGWTRTSLQNISWHIHFKRGSSNTETSSFIRIYGADLTVKYRIQQNV